MIKEYDREKAVGYARRWAMSQNPDFYHFAGIGGDCTNFISQCLLAGGGIMDYDLYYGWYYIDVTHRSPSWTGVEFLNRFLLDKSRIGPFASISSIEKLKEGDIIQLRQNPIRFNHSLIISKIENGQIYVCAHSQNALDRPLESYPYFEAVGLHIEGVLT